MANEAVIVELINGGEVIQCTCANATAITKGTLLKMTDPRTVIATAADNDPFAGIAAEDKVALDGRTQIAVYTRGIFTLACSAAVAVGERVSISGANTVTKVAAGDLLLSCVGTSLEAEGGAGTVEVAVHALI